MSITLCYQNKVVFSLLMFREVCLNLHYRPQKGSKPTNKMRS